MTAMITAARMSRDGASAAQSRMSAPCLTVFASSFTGIAMRM